MADRNATMARRIAAAVAQAGGRTYYVGGCVRDLLLGLENKDTDIEFNLDYFNSSTARIIVKILIASETLHGKSTNMHVTWYYRENDELVEAFNYR